MFTARSSVERLKEARMEEQEEAAGAGAGGAGEESGEDYPTIEAPEDSSLPFAPPGSEDQSATENE
jgi:hypothetical protein